jgi:protease II
MWRALVMQAPLVDVVGVMRRGGGALTREEYAEWGDVGDPRQLAKMHAYCPYVQSQIS